MAKKKTETTEDIMQPAAGAEPDVGNDITTQGTGATGDEAQLVATGSDTMTKEEVKDKKKAKEPKVSDALAKVGKALLNSNPFMSVVYMTSDGRGFYDKKDAQHYARTLNNKVVTPVKK